MCLFSWAKKLTIETLRRAVVIGLSLFSITLFKYDFFGFELDGSMSMEALYKIWEMVRAVA